MEGFILYIACFIFLYISGMFQSSIAYKDYPQGYKFNLKGYLITTLIFAMFLSLFADPAYR